ncbi:hypothetical protein EsVE80_19990 [Enterococcus saigonensis]|uniref:Uncharacterized protein n=1 Tax=Enterococcus saigonensis TaxID=1805431 RepID=A0A679IMG7_9ENTE|nr:hypothetical protein [Enterococcus saigonensis]BCA86476.1 hypothetical protein EsVE80_19990 [Enterococcus saigonensis]
MNELQYESNIELLGKLRDKLQHLEESEYMTAYYKGYSINGATLEEVKEEIEQLYEEINELQTQLDDFGNNYS